ncbi:MAG: hypothetical protein RLZZ141_1911 [Pseudomonadota bacterium]
MTGSRRSIALRSAALVVALATLASPALAQGPAPVVTDAKPMKLDLGYDGRLYIKVLDIQFNQTASPEAFTSKVRLVTYGLLRAFRKLDMRAYAQGRVSEGEPQPGYITHQNIDGKRNRKVNATWSGSDVLTTSTPTFDNMGDPPATRTQRVTAADPLTNFMRMTLASSQEGPCQGKARFYDGKQLYELDFAGPKPYRLGNREKRFGLVNPLRCTVRYIEVAGFKKKAVEDKSGGLRRPITTDWAQVGVGGPWVLSSLSAETPLGDAVIELARMNMEGTRP